MRFIIELFFAKMLAFAADIIDKKRGTSFAGRHALKWDANFVSKFKGISKDKVILVTGTNGKSSTTNLLYHIFKGCGEKVISNLAGANLRSGIATSFIKNSSFSGKINDGYIILEVDERTLKYILEWIPVGHLVITNIQADQVARNGCPEFIYNMFSDHIPGDIKLYLNNDEPNSKSFESIAEEVVYYGAERMPESYQAEGKLNVTMPCPNCHQRIAFEYYNISNIGKFHCTSCDYKSQEEAAFTIKNIDFENMTAQIGEIVFTIPYTARFMVYNYAAAIAVAKTFGLSDEKIVQSFDSFVNIEGRIDQTVYGDKVIRYIRTKQENPDTLQAAVDSIALDKKNKVVLFGLCVIDDFIPNYTNTFYSFDCNFEKLMDTEVERFICFDDPTCYDMANRLIYAGCPRDKIEILQTDDMKEVLEALDKCQCNNCYILTNLVHFHKVKEITEQPTGGKA